MNSTISSGIGGVIVGVALALLLFSTVSPFRNNGFGMIGFRYDTPAQRVVSVGSQTAGGIDKHFIEQMIPHHEGAIAMAKLALEKSKHSEVKTLAKAILASQSKEIADMAGWYKEWFGVDVPKVNTGMMGGGMMSSGGMHMGGLEDMTLLENAEDFDKAFLESMIPHHQLALMMTQMLRAGTSEPKMLQLAKNITVSQSGEIQQMQGWYTQWYK